MNNKFLVVLEQRNGLIKKSSFEIYAKAKDFSLNTDAVLLGSSIADESQLKQAGISEVTFFKNNELENYSSSAYTKILVDYIKQNNYEFVFIANTSLGKDLAPRLAAKLDCGIAMDCTNLTEESGNLLATRPVFAGKLLMQQKLTSPVKVFNIRPNSFGFTPSGHVETKINVKETSEINLSVKTIDIKKAGGKLDVAEADIIVSGGRGIKAAENFNLIENLANELNAAVGASRAVVDAGWRPHAEQVGQTGKTVSPNLYVAVGISGAIQHIAGMRSSKYIVAINKDKDAPIFQIADYGIVADAFEILPVLTEEIKKIKQ